MRAIVSTLLCVALSLTVACSSNDPPGPAESIADATTADAAGASCPGRPSSVEGQPCTADESNCALCGAGAPCCRQILVCLDRRWQHLEAGPCEP